VVWCGDCAANQYESDYSERVCGWHFAVTGNTGYVLMGFDGAGVGIFFFF
jgi:hypothetical protein